MPELNFYFNELDEKDFFNKVFDLGMYIVPDINYPTMEYKKITTVNEFITYRNITSLYYLIHDDYFESELVMFDLELENESVYAIMQKEGGPYIHGLCSNVLAGNKFLSCGMIGYYSKYFSTKFGMMVPAPEELKHYYNQLKKIIISNSIKQKNRSKVVYVGNKTNMDVDSGVFQLGLC